MFHYDRGLFLTRSRLAVDICRRQACGFISHAHADHIGRHELAFCTPTTGKFYLHRCGAKRRVKELPFRQSIEWNNTRLTTYPAGHILGSAMLHADDGQQTLLYSGDFRLRPSLTAERTELPKADIFVLESTFGRPRYRFPPTEQVHEELVDLVRTILAEEKTPVIHAYVLGKAQEVTRLLTNHGIPVLQHRLVHELSEIYEACGCELGDYQRWNGQTIPGHAVVAPPQNQRGSHVDGLQRPVRIAVSGWALDAGLRHRLQVDHALPMSDHADFDELIEAVETVGADEVYCTHGPSSFVDSLRERGYNAMPLDPS